MRSQRPEAPLSSLLLPLRYPDVHAAAGTPLPLHRHSPSTPWTTPPPLSLTVSDIYSSLSLPVCVCVITLSTSCFRMLHTICKVVFHTPTRSISLMVLFFLSSMSVRSPQCKRMEIFRIWWARLICYWKNDLRAIAAAETSSDGHKFQ